MAQSVIGALRVNLGLDSAQFERGAKRVNKPLQDMRKQFMVVAGAAAALGSALSAMALKGAQEIDRAAKSAQRLDASIGAFRALEIAAGDAGVSLSSITNDIQTMNRELARIGEGGNADRALKNLGIAASDIAGVDADEKMALIADRVQALGLSAGETTAILRDLGVRNREMALLMLGGGDAIRQARKDVEDYGLAISAVDAEKVEQANDRISRLGIISQYVGQQLAQQLVPPLGQLAQAMTDSMREGGALRGVLDALIGNIQRLSTYVATAVTFFGVRYVGALVAARIATLTLSGALALLRTALIRLGFGALIVGAGELVHQFGRLVSATGGFGEALGLLKDVAVEVMDRIASSLDVIPKGMAVAAAEMSKLFIQKLKDMTDAFVDFTWAIAEGINSMFDTNLSGLGSGISDALWEAEKAASLAAAGAGAAFNDAIGNLTAPLASVDALRDRVTAATEEIASGADSAAESVGEMNDALDETGSGGGAKAAADGIKEIEREATRTEKALGGIRDRGADVFADLVTRTTTLREAVASLASDLARMFAQNAFQSMFSSFFPGLPDFGGFRAAGGPVEVGKSYIVGERGPEWFTPSQSGAIIPSGQQGGQMQVLVGIDPNNGNVTAHTQRVAGSMDAQIARAQHKSYGSRARSYQMRGTT